MDAAVAELRKEAGHRLDLVAEQAGLILGFSAAGLPLPADQYRVPADLCIAAGAEEPAMLGWIEEGTARAVAARQVPCSGGM